LDSQKHRKIEAFCLAPKPEARKFHCAWNLSLGRADEARRHTCLCQPAQDFGI